MKIFFSSLGLSLALIFSLNVCVDPFGFSPKPVESIVGENIEKCAIDRSFIPEGAQTAFRNELARKANPVAVAVGSSRVGKIRREFVGTDRFVNFTLPDLGPDSYLRLNQYFSEHKNLKVVFLGMEFYAFGNQSGLTKMMDRTLAISEKLGARSFLEDIFLKFYELRGSVLFPNIFAKARNFVSEYLSLPATVRSGRAIWEKKISRVFRINLPATSQVKSRCLLSSTPEINSDGAWDPNDGTEYSRADLLGEAPYSDFGEYNPELFDGGEPSSHWHLFVGLSKISSMKLKVLDHMLEEFAQRGVKVIGFTSPFPDKAVSIWSTRGFDEVSRQFEAKVGEIFLKHGGRYFPPEKSTKIGCVDETDYDDVWHAGATCMAKAVDDIKRRARLIPGLLSGL